MSGKIRLSMDPLTIIEKYYHSDSKAYLFLTHHSRLVTEKALKIAQRVRHLAPDIDFIREASMLHDIGIFQTNEPKIGCYGDKAYICHGYIGREILEREGLPLHALVCERHIGVGITLIEIENKRLPIPKRGMIPLSLEEKIVCFADKFFSKDSEFLLKEKPLERIRKNIAQYGDEKLRQFDEWIEFFGT
jgi:uncharacterized protein